MTTFFLNIIEIHNLEVCFLLSPIIKLFIRRGTYYGIEVIIIFLEKTFNLDIFYLLCYLRRLIFS